MDYVCGYQVAQVSPTAEECKRIRTKLACVQDPCCRPCPPFEEHKLPPAGMPTGSGETVAETLNWKKPICVNPCDSVPNECKAISSCPPPPPKLMLGPCAPQPCPPCQRPSPPTKLMLGPCAPQPCPPCERPLPPPKSMLGPCAPQPCPPCERPLPPPKLMLGPCAPQPCPPCERPLPPITMALVDPCDTRCPHSATGCPSGKQRQLQQCQRSSPSLAMGRLVDPCNTKCPALAAACPTWRQQQRHHATPIRREDALLGYVGGPQTMASFAVVPVSMEKIDRPRNPAPRKLTQTVVTRMEMGPKPQNYDCDSKTSRKCENDCPECPIEIHSRTIYPKCEAMVPGYGGHVPGITTCKFGKTFGRETREALQKVYSTPQLKTYPKKC